MKRVEKYKRKAGKYFGVGRWLGSFHAAAMSEANKELSEACG